MATVVEIVKELLSYGHEKEWFEFKENWFNADELGEYVSALANGAAIMGRKNAYVVWGIRDATHEIVGTKFDFDQDVNHEPLKHYLARRMNPDVDFKFEEDFIEDKRIVLLTIPAAKTMPVSYAKERYIRIGSSKENIREFPEKESFLFHVLRNGLPSLENTPSQYQDLTFEKLMIYSGAKGLKLNEQTFKENFSFYTEDGKYNLLAQLFSDNSHMPIRVAIFSGRTKAAKLFSVREFGYQCLLYTLDDVLRYGDVLNVIQADETNRVVERKDVPLFDGDAFREAVINAFVHNLWVSGNEPMFTVFSDRIEILSRGTLAPDQTMEGFFAGKSVPVNKKLAEIMLQLRISEKTGRGVPAITACYGKEAYEFDENTIVVTIPFNWIDVTEGKEGKTPREGTCLTHTAVRILSEIRHNPNITRPQLAKRLGRGSATISRGLASLKEQGYVGRVGSNKTGYWKVLK